MLLCDALQMFDWVSHNKEVFLQNHTEMGVDYQHAVELQTQHNHFAMNSMVSSRDTPGATTPQHLALHVSCSPLTVPGPKVFSSHKI